MVDGCIAGIGDYANGDEVVDIGGKFVLPSPLMTLSFLALPMIPKLKLTDKGLFDGESFDFVPLFL